VFKSRTSVIGWIFFSVFAVLGLASCGTVAEEAENTGLADCQVVGLGKTVQFQGMEITVKEIDKNDELGVEITIVSEKPKKAALTATVEQGVTGELHNTAEFPLKDTDFPQGKKTIKVSASTFGDFDYARIKSIRVCVGNLPNLPELPNLPSEVPDNQG
jgi:hypothetical protein